MVDQCFFVGTWAVRGCITASNSHIGCTGVLGSLLLVDEPISTEQSGFGSSSDEQIPISRGDEVLFAGTTFGGGHPDVLHDGTVSGGSPCKSIFEVLVAERLDTSRAVLQAWILFGSWVFRGDSAKWTWS